MMRRTSMMLLLVALFSASVLLPSPLHIQAYADIVDGVTDPTDASGDITTKDSTGANTSCETIDEAKGGVLIGKIVPCLVYTIEQSTIAFTAQMVTWLMPLFYTIIALTLTFYGIRVMTNEPQVYKQGFMLLVKIAIISTIMLDLGNVKAFDGIGGTGKLIPAVYATMEESQNIIAGAINPPSSPINFHCDIAHYQGAHTPKVWAMMDCVMGKLYGFTTGSDGKASMLLATSVAGLASGFLFGGAWGVTVFFLMVGMLFTMFMMVIRTVVSFLVGYLIICLMLILSPLFLPLVFIRATAQYFDNFWRIILRAFLTPVIITAYTMFALIIYDQMLFAPHSILQTLFDADMIKDALQASRKACDRHVTGDPYDTRVDSMPTDPAAQAVVKDTMFKKFNMQNLAFPTLSGANDACNSMSIPVFKLDKVASPDITAGKTKEAMQKIFQEIAMLFLLAYLISEGEEKLPQIVNQLVGGSGTTTSGVSKILPSTARFKSASQQAMSAAIKPFQSSNKVDPDGRYHGGYKSGGDFAKNIVRDTTNSATASRKAFFDAMKK